MDRLQHLFSLHGKITFASPLLVALVLRRSCLQSDINYAVLREMASYTCGGQGVKYGSNQTEPTCGARLGREQWNVHGSATVGWNPGVCWDGGGGWRRGFHAEPSSKTPPCD